MPVVDKKGIIDPFESWWSLGRGFEDSPLGEGDKPPRPDSWVTLCFRPSPWGTVTTKHPTPTELHLVALAPSSLPPVATVRASGVSGGIPQERFGGSMAALLPEVSGGEPPGQSDD